MTIIFANRNTLIVDDVSVIENFGFYTNKINRFEGVYPGVDGDDLCFVTVGDAVTGATMFHCGARGVAFTEKERNTYVFIYDRKNHMAYRLVANCGSVPIALPFDVGGLSIWGDGSNSFIQAADLYTKGLILREDIMNVFHSLWLTDTSRKGLTPVYSGWLGGETLATEEGVMKDEAVLRLVAWVRSGIQESQV